MSLLGIVFQGDSASSAAALHVLLLACSSDACHVRARAGLDPGVIGVSCRATFARFPSKLSAVTLASRGAGHQPGFAADLLPPCSHPPCTRGSQAPAGSTLGSHDSALHPIHMGRDSTSGPCLGSQASCAASVRQQRPPL